MAASGAAPPSDKASLEEWHSFLDSEVERLTTESTAAFVSTLSDDADEAAKRKLQSCRKHLQEAKDKKLELEAVMSAKRRRTFGKYSPLDDLLRKEASQAEPESSGMSILPASSNPLVLPASPTPPASSILRTSLLEVLRQRCGKAAFKLKNCRLIVKGSRRELLLTVTDPSLIALLASPSKEEKFRMAMGAVGLLITGPKKLLEEAAAAADINGLGIAANLEVTLQADGERPSLKLDLFATRQGSALKLFSTGHQDWDRPNSRPTGATSWPRARKIGCKMQQHRFKSTGTEATAGPNPQRHMGQDIAVVSLEACI